MLSPSSYLGQDALERNKQVEMPRMAKGCSHRLKVVREFRGACQCYSAPTYALRSFKPSAMFMKRDFLSLLLIAIHLLTFFFPLAIMAAGFAVVAKHISFLFLLSLS